MIPTPTISPFAGLKALILKLTKGSIINLQVAKDKAGVPVIATVEDAEAILRVLTKPRRITPPVPAEVKRRYLEAHKMWSLKETPNCVNDGFYTEPVFPKIHTSGGLTTFVITYLTWLGHYGNRINTVGRRVFNKKKNQEIWIKGATKTGTGDTVACIFGKMYWFEIKIKADTPSDKQLEQQRRVRSSGGEYFFIKTAEEFLYLFDSICYG